MLKYMIFVYLISIMLLCSGAYNKSQTPATGIWETTATAAPGDLLHKLDLYTSNVQFIDLPVLQRRAGYASSEESSGKPYDYERAYDEFVQQYFSKAAKDDSRADSAAAYSAEDLSSYEVTAASKAHRKALCKTIYKNQQTCEVCKNTKNGETTENCAYARQSKPQNYAYEKQKNYEIHRSKSTENQSEETEADDSAAEFHIDDSNSEESIELKNDRKAQLYAAAMLTKAHASNKQKQQQQQQPRSLSADNDKTSSCIKKPQRNKICFYCKNTNGEKLVKCYATTFTATALPDDSSTASHGDDEQSHEIGRNLKKSQQRIYKRTVSYTYEKTARDHKINADNKNNNATAKHDWNTTTESSEELPAFRRKVHIKVIKRKHLAQN